MQGIMKHLPVLPAERALKVIAGRWKAVILHRLYDRPKRLSALQKEMPGITQKMLIHQLRELEAHGLVLRATVPTTPWTVEYRATALGRSLEPILLALCDWGRKHAEALDEADRLAACEPVSLTRPQMSELPVEPDFRSGAPLSFPRR